MANILKRRNIYSSFNGVSSYLQYADADIFSFTDGVNDLPFVIEFDVYLTELRNQFIVAKRNTSFAEWSIQATTTNAFAFKLYNNAVTSIYLQASVFLTSYINKNLHIKWVYDGSGSTLGFKIYINNILTTFINESVGVYTGMVNTTCDLTVGRYAGNSQYTKGYLRNLKITMNNQLVFHATLQDSLAIGKDIISGISPTVANNVSVVDINEGGNWSYFNNTTSVAQIGTTSTFGWLNSGVFNMEFDIKFLNSTGSKNIIYTAIGVSSYGFRLYWFNNSIYVYYYNGITITPNVFILLSFVLGDSNKIIIRGDGIKLYYTVYNYNNTVKQTNEPIGVNYTFIPNVTTQVALTFSSTDFQIRNLKIFTDFAGTIPFLSLPMQSAQDLMIDRVSGLVGTSTDVKIINNNTNVLKSQNKWARFDGTGYIANIGTIAQFNYLHKTANFKFEVDFIPLSLAGNYCPFFCNKLSSGGNAAGVEIGQWTSYIKITIANGTVANGHIYLSGFFTSINTLYKIKVIADGTTLSVYRNGILFNSVGITGVLGVTDSQYNPYIGRSQGQLYYLNGYLRNVKFYSNPNDTIPSYQYTLQDSLNIGKDIIGGLNGTVTNVSVVNQIETQNSAYFNGVNSVASIGTTSTFGWMNSGTFYIEFEYKPISYINNGRLLYTGYGLTSYGIMLQPTTTQLRLNVSNGSGAYGMGALVLVNCSFGSSYRIVIRADGSKVYFTTYYADGSVCLTNEPTGVSCNFIPNATTTNALGIGSPSAPTNFQLRNFKIFTDFAGTIPFMSLPMQDAPTLMTDRITGLQGTATNVSIVNNNTNVLRSKNLWAYFNGDATTNITNIGTTTTFNFIHKTAIFRVEFEWITPSAFLASKWVLVTGNPGISCYISNTNGTMVVNLGNGVINCFSVTTSYFSINTSYFIEIYGIGTAIYCYATNKTTNVRTLMGSDVTITGTLSSSNQSVNASIGNSTSGFSIKGHFKNFKIYQSSDKSQIVANLPLTDGGNIGKDVQSGLQGTVTNVKVVEI